MIKLYQQIMTIVYALSQQALCNVLNTKGFGRQTKRNYTCLQSNPFIPTNKSVSRLWFFFLQRLSSPGLALGAFVCLHFARDSICKLSFVPLGVDASHIQLLLLPQTFANIYRLWTCINLIQSGRLWFLIKVKMNSSLDSVFMHSYASLICFLMWPIQRQDKSQMKRKMLLFHFPKEIC